MKSYLIRCVSGRFSWVRASASALLLALLTLPLATSVSAQTITTLLPPTLSFDDDDIISVPGWTPYLYNAPGNMAATFVSAELHSSTWLGIQRTASSGNSGQLTYTETMLDDFVGSVILGATSWNSGSDAIGVILRASTGTFGNTSAYYLAVNNAGLTLYYGLGSSFTTSDISDSRILARSALTVASLKVLTESANNQYRLEFSFIGNVLDASLWELGAGVGGSDLLISTLTYTDERPQFRASGYFALRGGRFGGNRSAYFRDLYIGTPQIPEPATAALVVVGLLGGAMLIRRSGSLGRKQA